MRQKLVLSAFAFICTLSAIAQRPVRKGVKPVQVHEVVYEDAAPMFDLKKMNGKWVETKRSNTNGNPVSYTDSLMIMIDNGKGFVKTMGSMDMIMKGDVRIERGNVLNVAGSVFTVNRADGNVIVLKDDNMIKTLQPVKMFSYETPRTVVAQESFNKPIESKAQSLEGKWQVYKKQAPPGFIKDDTKLVKWISFSNISGEGGFGEMVTYDGSKKMEDSKFTFTLSGGTLTLKTSGGDLTYTVYKNDGDEFVFGKDGEIMNYSKK